MIDQEIIRHHIQKYIVGVLMHQKYARFRDLRPPKVDTNLYSYHLKALQKSGIVDKQAEGYTLGKQGILYVDRISTATFNVRSQPKIITMLVIQNSEGEVLLFKRKRQPYTDTWTLPYGKLHIDDATILASAQREAREKLGLPAQAMIHAGDCYIRINENSIPIMSTLAHVFRFETDDIQLHERLQWVKPHKLSGLNLAPAVESIVARTFFRDPYFFEEFEEDWYN